MTFDRARLRAAYGAFLGAHPGRVLLTGHSHQAWPDASRTAMAAAFDDAARFVDDKWAEAVFPLCERVGQRILARLGFDQADPIAFGQNTHELVYRLFSCFPRDARVTVTSSEFHSLHRQLRRLEEDGLRVSWVDASVREGLSERLLAAARVPADVFALSAVLFEDAFVVPRLAEIVSTALSVGSAVLIDAYHAFNVVPLALGPRASEVFLTAGGYKYAEFGEGVCFLRLPRDCRLRPRFTGWFADFESLDHSRSLGGSVGYGPGGARFAGATFDPTAFYRADAALALFDGLGLDVPQLRSISVAQTSRIAAGLERAGIPMLSSMVTEERGGFVAARVPGAAKVVAALRKRGVFVDARGSALRLGPAPYLTDEEIDRGVELLLEEVKKAEGTLEEARPPR